MPRVFKHRLNSNIGEVVCDNLKWYLHCRTYPTGQICCSTLHLLWYLQERISGNNFRILSVSIPSVALSRLYRLVIYTATNLRDRWWGGWWAQNQSTATQVLQHFFCWSLWGDFSPSQYNYLFKEHDKRTTIVYRNVFQVYYASWLTECNILGQI